MALPCRGDPTVAPPRVRAALDAGWPAGGWLSYAEGGCHGQPNGRRGARARAACRLLVGVGGIGPSGAPSGSTGTTAASEGNGILYTSPWDTSAGTRTITSHPIGAGRRGRGRRPSCCPDLRMTRASPASSTGSVHRAHGQLHRLLDHRPPGPLRRPGQRRGGRATMVRGRGPDLQPLHAPGRDPVARTTELGRDPETGEGPAEGTILVSSLADGSTISELGPFADLSMMLGTGSPDEVLHRDHAGPVRRRPERPEHRASAGCLRRADHGARRLTRRLGAAVPDRGGLRPGLHLRGHPVVGRRRRPGDRSPTSPGTSRTRSSGARPTGASCTCSGSRSRPPRRPRTPSPEPLDGARADLPGRRQPQPRSSPSRRGDRRSGHALADPGGAGRRATRANGPLSRRRDPPPCPARRPPTPSPIVSAA